MSNVARRGVAALALTVVAATSGCAGTAEARPGYGPAISPVSTPTPTPSIPASPPPAPPNQAPPNPGPSELEDSTAPPVSDTHQSGTGQGCVALAGLLTTVHTESDLIAARRALTKIIDALSDGAGPDDQLIIYQAEWVRNALSVEPDDPTLGDQWADTVARTLQELFTACVDAGYVERPS